MSLKHIQIEIYCLFKCYVSCRHVRREAIDSKGSKKSYDDLQKIVLKLLIEKNPTNVTLTSNEIKSDVLPRVYGELSTMDITDDKIESFKKNARKDLSEAKVEELVELLMKVRKSKPPKDEYIEEVRSQLQLTQSYHRNSILMQSI